MGTQTAMMANQTNNDEARCRTWHAVVSDFLAERNIKTTLSTPYGAHPRQKLDIYHARINPGSPPGPIAIFLYGGSWTSGERACYSFVGSALAARGITTVVPDYRLYPEVRYPAFNQDAAAAYAWVAQNLTQSRQQPLFLVGHSAGAHIASLIAFDPSYLAEAGSASRPPSGLVAMSGPYGFDPTTWPTTKEIFATAPDTAAPRPTSYVGAHCPPSLLVYGLKDDVVQAENARELRDLLQLAGADTRLIEYPALGHTGTITSWLRFSRWRASVLKECVAFIRAVAANHAAPIPSS